MKIGAHESIAGGHINALNRAKNDGCESLQIFLKAPGRWTRPSIDEKKRAVFKEQSFFQGYENLILSHTSYLINLASPKQDVYEKSIISLKEEAVTCENMGIKYCVMHPGSHLGAGYEAGLRKIVYGLDEVLSSTESTFILLENTAATGNSIGGNMNELSKIIESVKMPERLGVCIDTCHMFAAGYNIVNDYNKIFDDLISRFGDKIKAFHLNDSKNPLSSKKDRHEIIGKGFIGDDFFKRILNDDRFMGIPAVLETPNTNNTYINEINHLKYLRS